LFFTQAPVIELAPVFSAGEVDVDVDVDGLDFATLEEDKVINQ